jgi:hypothetical protein
LRIRRPRLVILVLAFALAASATVVFGVRAVVSTIYWSQHRDEPIQPWMTVGMIARSYDVPRERIAAATGVDPADRDRRPLSEIAAERGVPVAALVADIERAIAELRASPEPPP